MKNKITKLLAASAVLATSSIASGATLQFDFGDNEGAFAGTNAPAATGSTVWNADIIGDVTDGSLLYADGSFSNAVLDIGSGADGSATFFDGGVGNSGNNNPAANGVLGTALGQDWIFTTQGNNLGVRVSGLEAGTYDVFALVREPNQLGRAYDVGIGVGDTSTLSDLTVFDVDPVADNSAFVEGGNFVQHTVTISGASDFITILVDPTNTGLVTEDRFGTIAGLQIVAVPEPSSVALLGLGFMGFVLRRKR